MKFIPTSSPRRKFLGKVQKCFPLCSAPLTYCIWLGGWDRQSYGLDAYGYRQTYSLPDNPTQPCYEQFTFQSLPEQPEPTWRVPYCGAPPPDPPRYQDSREKIFVNLCNIFPPDLVRLVMKRNPHMTDAQQLAAAILVEKSQLGY